MILGAGTPVEKRSTKWRTCKKKKSSLRFSRWIDPIGLVGLDGEDLGRRHAKPKSEGVIEGNIIELSHDCKAGGVVTLQPIESGAGAEKHCVERLVVDEKHPPVREAARMI